MSVWSVDFETFYDTAAGYGIRQQGAWHYTRDERFDPYMVSVCNGTDSWSGSPRDFNWSLLEGATVLSHNRYFDGLVYSRMVEQGVVPDVKFASWECTANLTSFLCNRRALADAYFHLYKEKVSKEVRASADGRKWSEFPADDRKAMLQYALSDAVKCHRFWTDHSHRWSQFERDLSNQTIDMGWRGVNVDWDKVDQYLSIVHGMLMNTEALLPWVKDGGKPTSPKEIAAHCRRVNIPAPPVKTNNEEAYLDWEDTYAPTQPWILCVSSRRSLATLLKLLETIKSRRRADGTMPFALKYFGGHTGRWSGDSGVNMQNQRRDLIFRNEHGLLESDDARVAAALAEQDETGNWPNWVTATLDLRSIYLPRNGKKFIISDLSQIEPRVLNWIAGNHDLLKRISGGEAIYEAFAREKMGWTGGTLKDENKGLYSLAKAQVLGLGFGCGWSKFITVAQKMAGIDITKDDPEIEEYFDHKTGEMCTRPGYGKFSRECVQSFRADNTKIVDLWKALDSGFKSSVGDHFSMTLPSGRVMQYRDVRRTIKVRADDEGNVKKDWQFTAEIDGKRYGFYGGALTENLVQATARDVFGTHLLSVERAGLGHVAFHCHDEMIVEADMDTPKEEVQRVMRQAPEWMPGLPLDAGAVESDHYLKD